MSMPPEVIASLRVRLASLRMIEKTIRDEGKTPDLPMLAAINETEALIKRLENPK